MVFKIVITDLYVEAADRFRALEAVGIAIRTGSIFRQPPGPKIDIADMATGETVLHAMLDEADPSCADVLKEARDHE